MPHNLRPLIHQETAPPGHAPAHPHPAAAGHAPGHGNAAKPAKRELTTGRLALYGVIIVACAAGGVYFFTRSTAEPPAPAVVDQADKITEALRKAEAAEPKPAPVITPPPPGLQAPKSAKSRGS